MPVIDTLDALWKVMDAEKGDLITRSENYARLTLPYLCAPTNSAGQEQDRGSVAIGPRLVNHLANKVVDTMFPHDRPFFVIALSPEARRRLRKDIGDNEAAFSDQVRLETVAVEQAAMRKMDLTSYRTRAVEVVKHLEVTGNVLIRRMQDGKRVVYGVRDYCIRRDIDGTPNEILLRDAKNFGGLSNELRERVRQDRPLVKDSDVCVLFSHYKMPAGAVRWEYRQAVDTVMIDNNVRFKPVDLPVLPLAWTLERGSNYARGLVEDYIVSFHNLDVCSLALTDMIGVLADIKFLVDPASIIDVVDLNASPRGSYHSGRKDDISTPEGARNLDITTIDSVIQRWERELSQAFLLNSSSTRQAERVTAEEIRFVARELEAAFGGLYSRLAIEWQQYEAQYAVSQIDFNTDLGGIKGAFEVMVTTGLESLSREGQLANLRNAVADLQMLEAVPQEVRATINPAKFASFVFTNHTVALTEFMFSQEEMQANQQQQMQQQQDLANVQANANVQEAAGVQAVKGP